VASLVRNTAQGIVTRVTIIGAGAAISALLPRYLGPAGMGTYSVINSAIGIGAILGGFGIHQSIIYHIGRRPSSDSTIASTGLTLAGGAGVVLAILVAGLLAVADVAGGIAFPVLLLLTAAIPFKLFQLVGQSVLLAKGRILLYNLSQAASWLTALPMLAIVLVLAKQGTLGALAAWCFSILVAGVLSLLWVGSATTFRVALNRGIVRDLLVHGGRAYVGTIVLRLLTRLDLFLVSLYLGEGDAGLYGASIMLGELILHLPSVVGPLVFAKVASATDDSPSLVARAVRVTLALSAVAAGGLGVLSFWLLPLIWGDAFRLTSVLFAWLTPGIVAYSVFSILLAHLQGKGFPQTVYVVPLIALAANVGLDVGLLTIGGVRVAAISSSVAYTLGAVILGVSFVRQNGVSWADLLLVKRRDLEAIVAVLCRRGP